MNLRPCLLLLLAATLLPLRAQEEPVHMRPEFPLAFPLTNMGEQVTVKYPVMINQTTVIKPGMQLRVLFRLSNGSQDGTTLSMIHSGSLEDSYARDPAAAEGSAEQAGTGSSNLMHEIEGYRRTVWAVPNNFILTWAQFPIESLHLIYSPTARDSDLRDEMFNFFDGLFVGSPGGKVTVIAVERESVAAQAGMKAGDTILAVGGYPTKDDLKTFASDYQHAKDDAKESGSATYPMALRNADGTSRTANLAMPMRLEGGLMDGFSTTPPPVPAPEVPAPAKP